MKFPIKLLLLFAAGWGQNLVAYGETNAASTNRLLMIEPSSMPAAGGKATLNIGALVRVGGVYTGDYTMQVTPYFYKSEKGRLAIIVSDKSLALIAEGKTAAIIGTATTSGKSGYSRHVDATATPIDLNHGQLKLWFMAGDRKMVFEPAYHFAFSETTAGLGQTVQTNTPAQLRGHLPGSHREAIEAAAKHQ